MTPKDFKQKAKHASRWFVVESSLKAGEMTPTSPGLPSICNTSYLIVLPLAFTSFITRQMRDLPPPPPVKITLSLCPFRKYKADLQNL